MYYGDLRQWLDAVKAHGQIKYVNGASTDLEIGAISEIVQAKSVDPKPAVMFDDIPGYQKGYRVLCAPLASTWRIAAAFGLPEDQIDRMSLVRNWHKKLKETRLIPPKYVANGPVQANTLTDDKIDLLKFPSPKFHELDGGRYLGTGHIVIQKDPDTGWVNVGTYRVMLVDKNHLALHIIEGKHGSMIMKKYFSHNQVMPVVIAIGVEPALWCLSAHAIASWGTSEYDYAGGIRGTPIEVIKGTYTGLPFPANAEIVIEGECHPGELANEGPFGEWCGYYANFGLMPVPEPLIRVKAIYHRDEPILTSEVPAIPSHCGFALLSSVVHSVGVWHRLDIMGIPGVKGVWCHAEAAGGMHFNVISIEQLYAGHSRDVGLVASAYAHQNKYTVIVEDDIDPSNLQQVIWAITTRGQPDKAIQILNRCRSNSADPTIPMEEKRKYKTTPKPLYASRVIIDACRPLEWKEDWYPVTRISTELETSILNKWKSVLSDVN